MPTAVAMAIDYCLFELGLHRIEVAIRPENARQPARRGEARVHRDRLRPALPAHRRRLARPPAVRDHRRGVPGRAAAALAGRRRRPTAGTDLTPVTGVCLATHRHACGARRPGLLRSSRGLVRNHLRGARPRVGCLPDSQGAEAPRRGRPHPFGRPVLDRDAGARPPRAGEPTRRAARGHAGATRRVHPDGRADPTGPADGSARQRPSRPPAPAARTASPAARRAAAARRGQASPAHPRGPAARRRPRGRRRWPRSPWRRGGRSAIPAGLTVLFLFLCRRQVRRERRVAGHPRVRSPAAGGRGPVAPRRAIRVERRTHARPPVAVRDEPRRRGVLRGRGPSRLRGRARRGVAAWSPPRRHRRPSPSRSRPSRSRSPPSTAARCGTRCR